MQDFIIKVGSDLLVNLRHVTHMTRKPAHRNQFQHRDVPNQVEVFFGVQSEIIEGDDAEMLWKIYSSIEWRERL